MIHWNHVYKPLQAKLVLKLLILAGEQYQITQLFIKINLSNFLNILDASYLRIAFDESELLFFSHRFFYQFICKWNIVSSLFYLLVQICNNTISSNQALSQLLVQNVTLDFLFKWILIDKVLSSRRNLKKFQTTWSVLIFNCRRQKRCICCQNSF